MATILFPSSGTTGPHPKIHFSSGHLPHYISPSQPPTKKSPWRQIRSAQYISSLTVTMPTSLYHKIWPSPSSLLSNPILQQQPNPTSSSSSSLSIKSTIPHPPTYQQSLLTLPQVLTSPSFFTKYIKDPTSNILMLSEGTPGSGTWFGTFHEGKLHLEMAREIYERCGLQGVVSDRNGGGRKHGRDRWVVEVDLRVPSMVAGRKGFERLVRAAREVLGEGRWWIWREADGDVGGGNKEIERRGKRKREGEEGEAMDLDQSGKADQKENDTAKASQNKTGAAAAAEHEIENVSNEIGNADKSVSEEQVITQHNTKTIGMMPNIQHITDVPVPSMLYQHQRKSSSSSAPTTFLSEVAVAAAAPEVDDEDHHDLIEFFSLLSLHTSTTTSVTTTITSFTSTSSSSTPFPPFPFPISSLATSSPCPVINVTTITYTGLLDPQWVTTFLIESIRRSRHVSHPPPPAPSDQTDSAYSSDRLYRPREGTGQEEGEEEEEEQEQQIWAALQITTHRTEAVGQRDGSLIVLRSGGCARELKAVTREEEEDVEMGGTEEAKDGEDEKKEGVRRGFQMFTCYEFVDTLRM